MLLERYNPSRHPYNDAARDHWNRYSWALESLPLGRVLDAGCGVGYGSSLLANDPGTISVTAVDNSFEALFSALTEYPSPKVTCAYTEDISFFVHEHRFDTIVAFGIFEYVSHPDSALLNLWSLSHFDSTVIVSFPIGEAHERTSFSAASARELCSKCFSIGGELHQSHAITFKLAPKTVAEIREALNVGKNSIGVFMCAGDAESDEYHSSIKTLREMHAAETAAFILTDCPDMVQAATGYSAFLAPIDSHNVSADTMPRYALESILRLIFLLKPAILYSTPKSLTLAEWAADYAKLPLLGDLRDALGDKTIPSLAPKPNGSIKIVVPTSLKARRLLCALLSSLAVTLCSIIDVHIILVVSALEAKEINDLLQTYSSSFQSASVAVMPNGPFSFSAAVNLGYDSHNVTLDEGVLVLNDDIELSSMAALRIAGWRRLKRCLVGPVSNSGGGFHQQGSPGLGSSVRRTLQDPAYTSYRLAGFCLWIPAGAMAELRGFDPRFNGYGCDDTDLCLRASQAKFQLMIDRECFVYHAGGQTYGREFDSPTLVEMQRSAIAAFLGKHKNVREYHMPLNVEDLTT